MTTSVAPTGAGLWRAGRPVVLLVALILLVFVGSVVALFLSVRQEDPLATGSAEPDGTRALATLLRDQGVSVRPSDDPAAAAERADAGTTLVVADSTYLTRAAARRLAGTRADLVLLSPSAIRLPDLAPRVRESGTVTGSAVAPACDLPAAQRAGSLTLAAAAYRASGPDVTARCYSGTGGAAVVVLRQNERTITVVGTTEPFTNGALGEGGNAAFALDLLGPHRSLQWLLPGPDAAAGERTGSFGDLVPMPVKIAAFGGVLALALFAFARGRRIGPVVAERLPVVVRAAETTEGRARLYRALRARGRAAEALRSGTAARLSARLGLPRGSDPVAVVAAVAARVGRDPTAVHDLLYGAAPAGDDALVTLARDLDTLEREVRRS